MKPAINLIDGPRLTDCEFSVTDRSVAVYSRQNASFGFYPEHKVTKFDDEEELITVGLVFFTERDSSSLPFELAVYVEAEFELPENFENYEARERDEIVAFHCIPLLWVFMKEIVADITRKSDFAPLYIGDYSPHNFIESKYGKNVDSIDEN